MIPLDKVKFKTYNDGILNYGTITAVLNESKKKVAETFAIKGTLYYSIETIRESDIVMADNLSYTIDLKISVPFNNIRSIDKIEIDNKMYDIKRNEDYKSISYIYLQRVAI